MASKVRPTTEELSASSGRQAWVSEAKDQAETWNAVAACSQATSGKPSPIASCGAKPMEWTTPSRVSTCSRSRSASESRCSVLVTSSSTTAASCGQPLRDPLAQRQAPEVGEDDGGALLLGERAVANAIDASVSTPVTRIFLPSRMPISAPSPVRRRPGRPPR